MRASTVFRALTTAGVLVLLSGAAPAETLRALGTPRAAHTSAAAMERLAASIAETTFGRLEIVPEADVAATEVLDALVRGEAALAWLPLGTLGAVAPAYEVMALPFLFQDRGALARALDDQGLGPLLNDELRKEGLIALGYMTGDDLRLAASSGELSDLAGRRVAVLPGELREAVFRGLGAEPVPLDEAGGGVEPFETTLSDLLSSERGGGALTVTGQPHALGSLAVVANAEAYDRLPIDLQETLVVQLQDAVAWQAGAAEAARADQEEELRGAGASFVELPEDLRAAGTKAAADAVAAAGELGPPSIIEAILAEAR